MRRLDDIAFRPMPDWNRLTSFSRRAIFKMRLEEEKRLKEQEEATIAMHELAVINEMNTDEF